MTSRTVSTFKFVGSISLGLYTGLSYTLSAITIPTLLSTSSASSAYRAFSSISTRTVTHLRTLAGISSSSFLLAYILSPRPFRHPYLLWSALFVASSSFTDFVFPHIFGPGILRSRTPVQKTKKSKDHKMDQSFEVVSAESHSDKSHSSEDEEEFNGEEVREGLQELRNSQLTQTALAGLGFVMSVVGIWGDGAGELVIIEL